MADLRVKRAFIYESNSFLPLFRSAGWRRNNLDLKRTTVGPSRPPVGGSGVSRSVSFKALRAKCFLAT